MFCLVGAEGQVSLMKCFMKKEEKYIPVIKIEKLMEIYSANIAMYIQTCGTCFSAYLVCIE